MPNISVDADATRRSPITLATHTMKNYSNSLEINHKHKPIPYGGDGRLRDDGDANYGFKLAKGNSAALVEIPELQRDGDLRNLVYAINEPETGLFSVGCVSGPIADENGHRRSGYVEFALNSISAIADARSYFPMFFHFDSWLNESQPKYAVSYNWALQPATFVESQSRATGFTCAITINTHYVKYADEAALAWSEVLGRLSAFLSAIPQSGPDFIYPQ